MTPCTASKRNRASGAAPGPVVPRLSPLIAAIFWGTGEASVTPSRSSTGLRMTTFEAYLFTVPTKLFTGKPWLRARIASPGSPSTMSTPDPPRAAMFVPRFDAWETTLTRARSMKPAALA